MDYKDKLRLAKEALDSGSYDKKTIEYIFPELKKSEDERIRNEIIAFLKEGKPYYCPNSIKRQEWVAWLEKQNSNVDNANKEYWRGYREGKQEIIDKYAELEKHDEQKNTNKVKPKFKVGDWIISDTVDKNYRICKITDIKDGNYTIESTCGYKGYNQFDVFDTVYKLWK